MAPYDVRLPPFLAKYAARLNAARASTSQISVAPTSAHARHESWGR